MMNDVTAPSATARESTRHRFRLAVVVASVVAATVGSVLLATHHSGENVTTRGVTATLRVPGHPGWLAAGRDVLWVALNGDPRTPARNNPLVRLDLATGTVVQTVHLGGEVASLAHVGNWLVASVKPTGVRVYGPRRLVLLSWYAGTVLIPRDFDGPVDRLVAAGGILWALQVRPGKLFGLDPETLLPVFAPVRLSSGRTLGIAAGAGYLWITAADAGDVLRIDPATLAVTRVPVGGFPVGIAVAGGSVWFADRSDGTVVRFDPSALRPVGDRIKVDAKPNWLSVAGDSLLVTDEGAGTLTRIDVHSGKKIGRPIRVAPPASGAVAPVVASTGKSAWVSSFATNTLTRVTVAPSLQSVAKGTVTLRYIGTAAPVTNGGVAGKGRFTAWGAITDRGSYTDYRTEFDNGRKATIKRVTVGKKGTITFVITINLMIGSERWTIASGTEAYKGLHGKGAQTLDNYAGVPATFVMQGTVSR
jgi:hypothetical protein